MKKIRIICIVMIMLMFVLTDNVNAMSSYKEAEIDQVCKQFIENELSFLSSSVDKNKYNISETVEEYLAARDKYIKTYESIYGASFSLERRDYLERKTDYISDNVVTVKYKIQEMFTSTSLGETQSGQGGVYDYIFRLEKQKDGNWKIIQAYVNDDFTQAIIPELTEEQPVVNRSKMAIEDKAEEIEYNYDVDRAINNLKNIYSDNYVNVIDEEPISTRAGVNRKLNATKMREYQDKWWNSRNPRWGDFSNIGGDCTNYVSQVLNAGGAPLDPSGNYKWYYYTMGNRSSSWSGVNELRNYLIGNTYTGPEGSYYSGYLENLKIGDLIQLRRAGQNHYYHTLVLCSPGKDPIMTSHSGNRKQRLSLWSGYAGSIKIKTGYFD